MFPKWPRTFGRNGSETLPCDIIVVLNIAAFLRQWVFHGEAFGSKYKPYFTWEKAKQFARCSVDINIYSLLFHCFLSNCQLVMYHSEVKNRWYRVFLDYKLTKLERGSQRTPYYKILFEAVFGEVLHTNVRMLRGHEAFSFHFYKPFSFKFWVQGELESANFWFWVVLFWSSLWTQNQNSFKFPAFLELTNSDVTSFISNNYMYLTIFLTALRLWRILTFQYLHNASSNLFETSEYVYFILNEHIEVKWKNF